MTREFDDFDTSVTSEEYYVEDPALQVERDHRHQETIGELQLLEHFIRGNADSVELTVPAVSELLQSCGITHVADHVIYLVLAKIG